MTVNSSPSSAWSRDVTVFTDPPGLPFSAFQKLQISHVVEGGTRVEWYLSHHFVDPTPHIFQLQVTRTSAPTADDWEDVGTPVLNSFYAVDDSKRLFGMSIETHYRVILNTPVATYYSEPIAVNTALECRDWTLVREIVRQQRKLLKKYTALRGYLLKRKRFGTPCTCVSELTEDGTWTNCPLCYGTQINGGYYAAIPDYYIQRELEDSREEMDSLKVAGTVKEVFIKGSALGFPALNSKDVFIEKSSDLRYFIEKIAHTADHRGYHIRSDVELRRAPFSDTIYTVPLTGS